MVVCQACLPKVVALEEKINEHEDLIRYPREANARIKQLETELAFEQRQSLKFATILGKFNQLSEEVKEAIKEAQEEKIKEDKETEEACNDLMAAGSGIAAVRGLRHSASPAMLQALGPQSGGGAAAASSSDQSKAGAAASLALGAQSGGGAHAASCSNQAKDGGAASSVVPPPSEAERQAFFESIEKWTYWGFPDLLREAPPRVKSDKICVLAVVKKNGNALRYAADHLKADQEIVLAAMHENGEALQYAADPVKSDKEFLLAAAKLDSILPCEFFKYASDAMRSDKELVVALVTEQGNLLEHASDAMKSDREVALAAVRQYGFYKNNAIKHVNKTADWWHDQDFVLQMVIADGRAFEYASDDFKSDEDFLLQVREAFLGSIDSSRDQRAPQLLEKAPLPVKSDKVCVLAAVKNCGNALQYAADHLKADREVVLAAMNSHFGESLQYAADALKADKEVVLAAIKLDHYARPGVPLQYAADDLKSDKDVVAQVREKFVTSVAQSLTSCPASYWKAIEV